MEELKIFDAEYKFLDIVWDTEPVNSTKLVKLCNEKLGWKKTTMYTVLHKLCEKGVLRNENATVTAIVKREQAQKHESEALLQKSFGGSVPAFLTAFLDGRKLSKEEADEIRKMIKQYLHGREATK